VTTEPEELLDLESSVEEEESFGHWFSREIDLANFPDPIAFFSSEHEALTSLG